jgi:hypothetical protein
MACILPVTWNVDFAFVFKKQPLLLCQVSPIHLVRISLVGFRPGRILVLDFRRTGGAAVIYWTCLENAAENTRNAENNGPPTVLKIEVFSALQMGFGTSKNTSRKTTLQNIILMSKCSRHLK